MIKIIARLEAVIDKLILRVSKKMKKSGWIAHHGIQRSGTNFLLLCLKRYNLKIINRHDPERNDPAHKHFRWYENKTIIPQEIHDQYYNTTTVNNVTDLNKASNFPIDTKHIIIYKERHASLVSMLNWGLRVGWFNTKHDAISAAGNYLNDIDAYNKFWVDLSKLFPEYIQLVCYKDVVRDNTVLSDALLRLGFEVNSINLQFEEIPHSPKSRKSEITHDDVVHHL